MHRRFSSLTLGENTTSRENANSRRLTLYTTLNVEQCMDPIMGVVVGEGNGVGPLNYLCAALAFGAIPFLILYAVIRLAIHHSRPREKKPRPQQES